jgi:DNA-binding FadR family transcriptional regulator
MNYTPKHQRRLAMNLSYLEEQSLKEKFVHKIMSQILSGELPINAKLPSERQIAEKEQISRNVLRVGLEELSALGFLKVEPRRGAFVSDYKRSGNLLLLNAICKEGLAMPHDILKDLLDLCMRTLCDSAAKVALRRTSADLERMEALLAEEEAVDDDHQEELARIDFLFYKELYSTSGNSFLTLLFNSVQKIHHVLCIAFYKEKEDRDRLKKLHVLIVKAIRESSSEDASRLAKDALELGCIILSRNDLL